ncbi:MAG TPA: NAD-dependent epimerase/dehydratase family protein [Anaerolineales bacterium]|nr:NAD-dependent epimerase/dehydratase family protein [Anaerolineales bacterium]
MSGRTGKRYLVTGGAGFIGSNYADRLLGRGEAVTILDNLGRAGAEKNLAWLRERHGEGSFRLVAGDVRDYPLVVETVRTADVIIHLAAQVAVTTSVDDPRTDFEINAAGTVNVLEAARLSNLDPVILYASTNKVYGEMEATPLVELETRWDYADLPNGVPESQPIDFHSPYGCSKGAGDQYVRDFHRIYGLQTVVFRQGCIYGPRQFGVEDQGWVAWFMIAALLDREITIYGDGKQVRDLCHVEDLLDAYDAAVERIDTAAGRIYNIGGGKANTLSIWAEFGPRLEEWIGAPVEVARNPAWRLGDQRVNYSDLTRAGADLDWTPKIGIAEGIPGLLDWIRQNISLFE